MDLVLDVDLDYFVWPPFVGSPEQERLPDTDWECLASEDEVREFLEESAHLSARTPLRGRCLVEHAEAFTVWRNWLRDGQLTAPFEVVHVDAHADLGAGCPNTTFSYLEELLAPSAAERSFPRMGCDGLNSTNYLVGAIANRWISRLTYVYPTCRSPVAKTVPLEKIGYGLSGGAERGSALPPTKDLPHWCFKNGDWRTCRIQLGQTEPEVPFECMPDTKFDREGFTHFVLAQSPQYTPLAADALFTVAQRYLAYL